MTADILPIHRRNIVERWTVRIMRGEIFGVAADSTALRRPREAKIARVLAEGGAVHFRCLRELARQDGLEVQSPGARYLTSGELLILRWLAEAQRHAGLRTFPPGAPGLMASLTLCARILKDMDVFLPARTLAVDPSANMAAGRPPDRMRGGDSLAVLR